MPIANRHSRLHWRRLSRPAAALIILLTTALTMPGELGLVAAGRLSGSQNPAALWREVGQAVLGAPPQSRQFRDNRYRVMRLDRPGLDAVLAAAPREFTAAARGAIVRLELPWPDGGTRVFRIEDSPVMDPDLALKFPELRTYRGQGLDDPTASVRFDWTPAGFHAIVLSGDGTVYIDPFSPGDVDHYLVYFRRDYERAGGNPMRCGITPEEQASVVSRRDPNPVPDLQVANGTQLRTYRLAMAATGEYTAFHGGTVIGAMSAIVTTVNRINSIYERDLAVHMNLVGNNSAIVFTNGGTDPYSNNDGDAMLCQNAATVDSLIGSANYDIGHVFSTGGGGIAGLGVVCNNSTVACAGPNAGSSKARGVTGLSTPVGDAFDVDFVAHEIGHQFGGHHTFNGTTGNCGGGNRTAVTAYEPGSGSTIQAYAGICGAENLQAHSDDYFHAASQDEMINFISVGGGSTCGTVTATGNTPPTVSAGANFTIPQSTPFTLTASGADVNGDTLTFTWEEFDLGTASPPSTDNGSRPLFRSFLPTVSPSRTFPKLSSLINNTTSVGETLPTTTRSMTFRVTARDNRSGGGGTASDDMVVSVSAASGPFVVTQPNTAIIWAVGTTQTVAWNVASTTAAPVNAASVKILLSTDGGLTYPTVLANSTPNDGSESITVPGLPTTTARVRVEGAGNIFFDISNVNFTITGSSAPSIAPDAATITTESLPPNGVLDPGETVTVEFRLRNDGAVATSNLVATLQSTGGVLQPSAPVSYGAIAGGGGTATRTYSFRANPTLACGSIVTASLQVQDGATNLGTVQFPFTTGTLTPTFTQNFDGVAAPALPAGWTAANASGPGPVWVTSTVAPESGINAAFIDDPGVVSDKRLESPSISITSSNAQLSFRNNFNLEESFDGGVLEISLNGGGFVDILSAGGSFAAGGYTDTIDTGFQSPIAGRAAWTGSSGGYLTTIVNLPVAAAGGTVRFRWRMGSDNTEAAVGWRIDTVVLSDLGCVAGSGDFIRNGSFTLGATGTDHWFTFAVPAGGITSNVTNGVFQFFRTGSQALIAQETGVPVIANGPVQAQFQIGNSSTVRKRIAVLMHDSDFSDLAVCTFFLAPNTPLQSYQMRTHTTKAWANATISFFAATVGSDGGFYQLDNVAMQFVPSGPPDQTECHDANAPSAPGGVPGPDLMGNGDFNTGTLPPWGVFGQITHQIAGGVFEFFRPAGTPAGVVLQPVGQVMTPGQILTATFQLGNSSGVRKRVTVLLHDLNFTDLSACTFFIPPGQPLADYVYRTYATQAWGNATISFYPSTIGTEQWMRLDNVTLRRTPGTSIVGTECIEPSSSARQPAIEAARTADRPVPRLLFGFRPPGF